MAATDTWSCTAEVLPGRQAKSSVDVDQRATPAHYEARRRSSRHLPENGAQARPPSPPRPRARHGQPRPRVAMISACTGRVFDRRRNPGSMAVAGPGAPIVNSSPILCAILLCQGRTQHHCRVPVRIQSTWTASSRMRHVHADTASPRPGPTEVSVDRDTSDHQDRQLGF